MPSVLLLPLPRFVAYYPGTGAPLAGGFVNTFVPGSSTPKQTYQDALGTVVNPQPIVLDSAGSTLLYGTGAIEIRTTDALGNAIPAYSGVVTGIAPAVVPGFISGFTLTIDISLPLTVLDIAPGVASDASATATIALQAAFTKSISSAWVAGTGAPGMGIGVAAAINTWYHVFVALILGSPDVFFDTSATAANAPAGTSAFRRIGSIKLDAAAHIRPFTQYVDRFNWVNPVLEIHGTPLVTTGLTKALVGVPPGVPVAALLSGAISDSTSPQNALYISSLTQADLVPDGTQGITGITGGTTNGTTAFSVSVMTDTLAQIRYRLAAATMAINAVTNGWIDTRGRG